MVVKHRTVIFAACVILVLVVGTAWLFPIHRFVGFPDNVWVKNRITGGACSVTWYPVLPICSDRIADAAQPFADAFNAYRRVRKADILILLCYKSLENSKVLA